MVFGQGVVSGYFSGGCVESDVAAHAQACLEDGAPRTLVYGEGSPWPDIQLLCGARIEIFLEKVASDDPALGDLFSAQNERIPCVWLSDGRRRVCVAPEAARPWPGAIRRDYEPTPRLVVVGADPTALAIAALGGQSGFETTLIRPKGPTEPPPLAKVGYRRDEPGEALEAIGLDPWTAVAVATHDLATDQAALRERRARALRLDQRAPDETRAGRGRLCPRADVRLWSCFLATRHTPRAHAHADHARTADLAAHAPRS